MKAEFEVTDEDFDKMMVAALKEVYYTNLEFREQIENKDSPLADWEKEDLKNTKKIIKSCMRLLKYHMTPDEWKYFNGE